MIKLLITALLVFVAALGLFLLLVIRFLPQGLGSLRPGKKDAS